jgi:hypothetical protein
MRTAKYFLAIVFLLGLLPYDAFPYEYTWYDCRTPFTQFIQVPTFTSGSSTVYLDLPENLINTHNEITLTIDIESNLIIKHDGLEQRTFSNWTAYCSVNGAWLFGKHRLPVNPLPSRQTCSIAIATKDLKPGRNTLEFSMAPTDANVNWSGIYGKKIVAYGIHRMWLNEFSAPLQLPANEKGKDAPVGTTNRKQVDPDIETRLKGLKQLLDKGLIVPPQFPFSVGPSFFSFSGLEFGLRSK